MRSGTPITDPSTGIFIFKPNGGTEYLFYMQKTQIGRWDLAGTYATGWTDNHFTGLQSTTYHPVHAFNDRVYYGNKDRIGMVYDNAGTAANNTNVLNFPSDFTATALEDDGTYLIAAITKNQGDNVIEAQSKVIFWDKSSPSWNKEYILPDPSINGLKRVGSSIYALCGRSLYRFSFGEAPVRVRGLQTANALQYGYPNAVDEWNDSVLWGGGGTILSSYGKILPDAPTAYHEPFASLTGSPTLVVSNPRIASLVVGTASPKLYKYSLSTGGATGLTAETIYFDLGQRCHVSQIDVVLGDKLASGDQLTVSVQPDETTSASSYGIVSYTNHGAVRKVQLKGASIRTEQLKLKLAFDTGNVKIRRIDVYGTLEEQR